MSNIHLFWSIRNNPAYLITKKGKSIEEFKCNYTYEEYKETFSKTSQQTSCDPFRIHMVHWKGDLERERIMKVHVCFI